MRGVRFRQVDAEKSDGVVGNVSPSRQSSPQSPVVFPMSESFFCCEKPWPRQCQWVLDHQSKKKKHPVEQPLFARLSFTSSLEWFVQRRLCCRLFVNGPAKQRAKPPLLVVVEHHMQTGRQCNHSETVPTEQPWKQLNAEAQSL